MALGGYLMAAQQGLKFVGGIAQMIRSASMNPERPVMEASKALAQSKAIADNAKNARMVGAAAAEAGINRNLSATADSASRVAGNSAQALAVLAGANNDANNALVGLGVQEAADTQREATMQMNVNSQLAQEERMLFDVNKMQPYMQDVAAKNALMAGGAMNTYSALGDLSAASEVGMFDGTGDELVTVTGKNGEKYEIPKRMLARPKTNTPAV
jgi:hypothetical protein